MLLHNEDAGIRYRRDVPQPEATSDTDAHCLNYVPGFPDASLAIIKHITLNGRLLHAWLDERKVPTTDAMFVRRADSTAWVPLEEIARVSEIRQSYQWFRTGAIADAAGLAAALVFFASRDH